MNSSLPAISESNMTPEGAGTLREPPVSIDEAKGTLTIGSLDPGAQALTFVFG
jgi:hypothetical protein